MLNGEYIKWIRSIYRPQTIPSENECPKIARWEKDTFQAAGSDWQTASYGRLKHLMVYTNEGWEKHREKANVMWAGLFKTV
jgi:hypothetical protein